MLWWVGVLGVDWWGGRADELLNQAQGLCSQITHRGSEIKRELLGLLETIKCKPANSWPLFFYS